MSNCVHLSQFPFKKRFLRLALKNSKGCIKRIKKGADVYESRSFAIYLNPFNPCETFKLKVSERGSLLLTQDPEGDLFIRVAPNISLECKNDEPSGDYLYFETATHTYQGAVKRMSGFVPLN